MSATDLPDPALPPPAGERLHPAYLLFGAGKAVRGAWGAAAASVVFASQGRWWLAGIIVGGVLAASLGGVVMQWLSLRYRSEGDALMIDRGVLSRSHRAIPFARITDLAIEQNPLHRALGVARVRVESGGGGGDEAVLETISLPRATALRAAIRDWRSHHQAAVAAAGEGAPVASGPGAPADAAALFAMDLRRVLTLGLFNFSLAFVAILFGAAQTLGDWLGFNPFDPDFWRDLYARSTWLRVNIGAHRWLAGAAGVASLLLVGVVSGVVRTLLREHGFRLDVGRQGLRRRRGLLTRSDTSIVLARVSAARIDSGPLRARWGWRALRLQSLAQDASETSHAVAPLASGDEVERLIRLLGWSTRVDRWHPLAPGAPWARVIWLAPLLMAATAIMLVKTPLAGIAVAVILVGMALGFLSWRHAGFALEGDLVHLRHGWFRRDHLIVPRAKIETIDLVSSLLSRWLGFARVRLGVAGAGLTETYVIAAMAPDEAAALRRALLRGGA